MKRFTLCLLLLLAALAPALAQTDELRTAAEGSGYTVTMTNDEVNDYCRALASRSDRVTFSTIGTTDGGRSIPLLIIGDPAPAKPADLVNDPRLAVYIQANIHGGEVEGKEASLIFARDLAEGKYPEILEKLVVLIVPNYNADGNADISPENRYYQAGPDAVGQRYNARNLDLNRDWIKLEASETRSVVGQILNQWDPVLIVDCHTTNGSLHKEPMTWSPQTHPSGDRDIMEFTRTVLIPAAAALTEKEYGLKSIPYGNFMDREDRTKGWATFGYQGRYTTNYTGLRNRPSILLESYVYAPYKDRIWATYGFLRGACEYIAANTETVQSLIRNVDRAAYARAEGIDPETDTLAIEVERAAFPEEVVTIETWESSELYEDEAGRRRIKPAGEEITLEIPHYGTFTVTKSVVLPRYYVVDHFETAVIEKLQLHGIELLTLEEEATLTIQRFYPTEKTSAKRHNQGHLTTLLKGEWKTEETTLQPGTVLVSTAQPLGLLAAYLLEPECDDGLTAWNYFDHRLSTQWGSRVLSHPVLKITADADFLTRRMP